MEYIDGVNAGSVLYSSKKDRDSITRQIIDILISFHQTENEKGFGELNSDTYNKSWNAFYKIQVDSILKKASDMHNNHQLSHDIYYIMKSAAVSFDEIFSVPVEKASLIHGDYNMWNIMIDENKVSVVAVIDPYNSCWADAEFDLYQLNFSYGKEYGLLDAYKRRMGLSANFEMKCCFYELFTEVMHYYDSNTQINEELLSKQATALSFQLQKLKAEL